MLLGNDHIAIFCHFITLQQKNLHIYFLRHLESLGSLPLYRKCLYGLIINHSNSTGKEICLFDFLIGYFMYSMQLVRSCFIIGVIETYKSYINQLKYTTFLDHTDLFAHKICQSIPNYSWPFFDMKKSVFQFSYKSILSESLSMKILKICPKKSDFWLFQIE